MRILSAVMAFWKVVRRKKHIYHNSERCSFGKEPILLNLVKNSTVLKKLILTNAIQKEKCQCSSDENIITVQLASNWRRLMEIKRMSLPRTQSFYIRRIGNGLAIKQKYKETCTDYVFVFMVAYMHTNFGVHASRDGFLAWLHLAHKIHLILTQGWCKWSIAKDRA